MIETTRPELVAYQEERLAKFVNENQKLDKGQIVFAGDSITEFFALKKYLGRDFPLVNRGIAGTDSVWLLEHLKEQVLDLEPSKLVLLILSIVFPILSGQFVRNLSLLRSIC